MRRAAILVLVLAAGCGKPPEPPPAPVTGPTGAIQGRVLVSGREMHNAFVYIEQGLEGRRFPVPAEPVVLDQINFTFVPRVFGLRVGQPLRVTSTDPSHHNVNCASDRNRGFNVSLYRGETHDHRFTSPEVMIRLRCDMHPNMVAFAGVLDHPFFSVTRGDGSFEIAGLPPGRYVVAAWEEVRGTKRAEVRLGAGGRVETEFRYE